MSTEPATTVASLLRRNAANGGPAFHHDGRTWTWPELVDEGRRRAALWWSLRDADRPPHIGVLLDNVPDHLFWIVAAALSGSTAVGINSTYRGEQLGQLIRHSDCQLLVTSTDKLPLLEGAGETVAADRLLVVDEPAHAEAVAGCSPFGAPEVEILDDTLLLLIFTSGSTGLPKAVRCTQGRLTRTGAHIGPLFGLQPHESVYAPLPFFHSSALFTGFSTVLNAGASLATRTRFSASGTLDDVRRYGSVMIAYTGKVLNYILAVPPRDDDADNPLRMALGNEASEHDIREFSRRFGCTVRDSYGSTEGVIIVRRDPSMPAGALGAGSPTLRCIDPETGRECPPAGFDAAGRVTNLEECTGELVETSPSLTFEGYYKNDEAAQSRLRNGWYWSGDLVYRDRDGWFFFAGRSNEWLRVDGENFAAAPVEQIIGRHPDVRSVAVYAVPDDPVGDRVMAAVELREGASLDPDAFDGFLAAQPDLGPKWVPSFVRVTTELPKLASMKLDKTQLRRDAWRAGAVVWRPAKGQPLRPLTDDDRLRLDPLLPT